MRVSFDFWGTLVKANPRFKLEKYELLKDIFPGITADQPVVDQAFADVKTYYNRLIEQFGIQPSWETLYADLFSRLTKRQITLAQIARYHTAYQKLFLKVPPLFYAGTERALSKIAKQHEVYLSSNTLFVSGETLNAFIHSKPLHNAFSGFNYSDDLGVSKPHRHMFQFYGSNSHLHVGDNPVTDGGCTDYGVEFFQINSNDKTIKDVQRYLC